jgi:hypothetical protein
MLYGWAMVQLIAFKIEPIRKPIEMSLLFFRSCRYFILPYLTDNHSGRLEMKADHRVKRCLKEIRLPLK